MDWIKSIVNKIKISKEDVISLVFSIGLTLIIFLDNNYFNHTVLKSTYFIIFILLAILLTAVMLIAGFAVYRAAIHASVGFGIIIFLAKSYCELPTTTTEGIQALTTLWTVSFIYILFDFSRKLQEAYKTHVKKLQLEKEKSWETKVLIGIYILFILAYLILISQVLTPIVQNLCMYK